MGDGIDESEAQSMTVRIAPLYAALKDMIKHLEIEAGAIAFEDQRCSIFSALQFDRNRAGGRQVLQLIIEEQRAAAQPLAPT